MKKLLIVSLIGISLSGCMVTGEGTFNGRIVDVEWGGLLWKSCEVGFQMGEQSSTLSRGSTFNKDYCDALSDQTGNVVTIPYETHLFLLGADTNYLLTHKATGVVK